MFDVESNTIEKFSLQYNSKILKLPLISVFPVIGSILLIKNKFLILVKNIKMDKVFRGI